MNDHQIFFFHFFHFSLSNRASRRLGECKKLRACPPGHVYFPEKGGCHEELSQGPCIQGKLLMVDESSIPKCMVS